MTKLSSQKLKKNVLLVKQKIFVFFFAGVDRNNMSKDNNWNPVIQRISDKPNHFHVDEIIAFYFFYII